MPELRILRPARRPSRVAANLPSVGAAPLGAARGNLRKEDWIVFPRSMGQLRPARIDPRGQPIGSDVRCRVGKLANKNYCRGVVEMIEVFIVIRILSKARIAIRE